MDNLYIQIYLFDFYIWTAGILTSADIDLYFMLNTL
jgi:hypothetical protein